MASEAQNFRIVVFLSGRGSNFRAIVDSIEKSKLPIEIVCVVSDRAQAPGFQFAQQKNLPTLYIPRNPKLQDLETFHKKLLDATLAAQPDLVVLAGFMRILSLDFIKAFAGKIVNIHPSLLPSFVGLEPQAQALKAGVKIAGCTVHFVNEELDAGPIIAQAAVPVFPGDTVEELSDRILAEEHKVYPKVISALASRDIWLENGVVRYRESLRPSKESLRSL